MRKNTRTNALGRKLTWSTHESLRLHSEKIDEFLAHKMFSQDADYAKAVDFFKKIKLMMDDSNWVITTPELIFGPLTVQVGRYVPSMQP